MQQRASRQEVQRILGEPDQYPDEFKNWLPRFLNISPALRITKQQLTLVEGEAWHSFDNTNEPSLANGWSNYGTPYSSRFRKGYTGDVYVEMALIGGAVADGTVLTTLPAGYAPDVTIPVLAELGGAVIARVEIKPSGDIVLQRHGAGTNAYLLFAAVFRA